MLVSWVLVWGSGEQLCQAFPGFYRRQGLSRHEGGVQGTLIAWCRRVWLMRAWGMMAGLPGRLWRLLTEPHGGPGGAAGPPHPAWIGRAEIFVEISFLFSFLLLTKNTSDSFSTIPYPSLSLFFLLLSPRPAFWALLFILLIFFFLFLFMFFCIYFPSSLTATFFRPPSFYLCR